MGVAIVWTFAVPNAVGFPEPKLARIIFFHLPPAFLATGFFFAAGWFSLKYLRNRLPLNDIKAVAAVEIALLMACQTMAAGIIFSKVQWGAYWNWDPRQTSFLMVLLMFASYFALRSAFPDPEKRASIGAGYVLASLLPAIFLIFVFPRLPMNRDAGSLHPNDTIVSGVAGQQRGDVKVEVIAGDPEKAKPAMVSEKSQGFDRAHTIGLFGVGILLFTICLWAFRMRVRAGILEHEAELAYEGMDDRGRAAITGVVRPISVHDEGGGPSSES